MTATGGDPVGGLVPPYTAVIFTSRRSTDLDGYAETSVAMETLAARQTGYLGIESARTPDGLGITVSYWADEQSARAWKQVAEHLAAQRQGQRRFYESYAVRVALVEREYRGPR